MAVSDNSIKTLMGDKRINQFGDFNNERLTLDTWEKRWQAGQTRFHVPTAHPMLMKYIGQLEEGRRGRRIFLPMCGKTIDLSWLASRGHCVVGNEGVQLACRQFFDENAIPYSSQPIGSGITGTVFQSKLAQKDITLYCCDFFDLNRAILGTFDCIWDRGSLAAIYSDERPRYCEVLLDLMSTDTRYLLDIFHVDHTNFAGPPFHMSDDELNNRFGTRCQMEQLEKKDSLGPWQREWNVSYFDEFVYLLRLHPVKVQIGGDDDLQISRESRQSWWRWMFSVTIGWAPSMCRNFVSKYLLPTSPEQRPAAVVGSTI